MSPLIFIWYLTIAIYSPLQPMSNKKAPTKVHEQISFCQSFDILWWYRPLQGMNSLLFCRLHSSYRYSTLHNCLLKRDIRIWRWMSTDHRWLLVIQTQPTPQSGSIFIVSSCKHLNTFQNSCVMQAVANMHKGREQQPLSNYFYHQLHRND